MDRIPANNEREDIVKHVRLAILLASGLLLATAALQAQEKKMEAPKPGPEVKKLGYFVGTWNDRGGDEGEPVRNAGRQDDLDGQCEWFPGGFHVVCSSTGTGPMGSMQGLGIMAYNSEDKVYTYSGIDSTGFTESSKGKVDGNKWVYTSDEKMGGKIIHGRYSMETASPDSYTFKYETSADGNQWAIVMEGKSTKEKATAKK